MTVPETWKPAWRIHPVLALGLLLVTHAILTGGAVALGNQNEALVLLLGLASLVLPGLAAGYLTASRPLLVGVAGAALSYALGLLWLYASLGAIPIGLLRFSLGDDIAQAALMIGACVGGQALRRRLSP